MRVRAPEEMVLVMLILATVSNSWVLRAVSYTYLLTFRINRKGDYHLYLAEIASGEKRSSDIAAADEVGACTCPLPRRSLVGPVSA